MNRGDSTNFFGAERVRPERERLGDKIGDLELGRFVGAESAVEDAGVAECDFEATDRLDLDRTGLERLVCCRAF